MTRIKKIVGVALLCLATQSAFSFPHDRELWIRDNLDAIAESMCDKKSFFRMCFLVTDKLCKRVARLSVSRCMDEYRPQMPATLEIPFHDHQFRPLIGSCSGSQYEARLKNYSKNEKRCSEEGAFLR